ncbi:MAG TPA: hypothetical protein VF745_10520 [Steroidobacteraceae bacterium]
MKKSGLAVACALIPVAALAAGANPIVLSKAEVGGGVFGLPGAKTTVHDGNKAPKGNAD